MIPGSKYHGGFTVTFTNVVEHVTFIVHCKLSGYEVPCSSKEVAEANKAYYERQGEIVAIEEKHYSIRCGEVQI